MARKRRFRAVVDANVWLSGLTGDYGPNVRVVDAFMARQFVLVCSRAVLDEVERLLLTHPRVKERGLTEEDVLECIGLLWRQSYRTATTGQYVVSEDPDDDKLIETAIRGSADAIVSWDHHLHADDVKEYLRVRGIQVLTPDEFLALLASQPTAASG